MLSYIMRLVEHFQHEHGCRPNLLYLNNEQVQHLKSDFSDDLSMQHLCQMLDMELVIDREVIHPHVAWVQSASRLAM